VINVVRDISGSVATRYGLTVCGSNPGGGARFSATIQSVPGAHPERPWGPTSLLFNRYRSFVRVKRLGRRIDHPPPSGAKDEERAELYLYSPSWASPYAPTTFTTRQNGGPVKKLANNKLPSHVGEDTNWRSYPPFILFESTRTVQNLNTK
jgi:hypothetical protein